MIGRTVSHYRIVKKLGEGGMGVVYLAEDVRLRRSVALKLLPDSDMAGTGREARLQAEAEAAAALNHPNICTIHEIDRHEGREFIVMEYLEGRTLDHLIAEGPLELQRALAIIEQVGEGLEAAHAQGIVHRDLKPSNIMITGQGRAKILDFGLARAVDRTQITRPGTTLGTAAYMSPEQVRGEQADRRADLWSLGVVFYEMLVGLRPFRGDHDQAALHAALHDEPAPLTSLRSGLPVELDRIIAKLLAKRRDERYQHVDDFLADLRGLARRTQTGQVPIAPATRPHAGRPRRTRWWVAGGAVLVAAAGALLLVGRGLMGRGPAAVARPIAVIRFDNMTGDPAYDYLGQAIPNLLITSLEQSRQLRVTTWERMGDLLRQLGRSDPGTIDRDAGFEACRLDGVDLIVTGSFVKAGDAFVTEVKVLDVASKRLLASASARGEGPESVLQHQVDDLSGEIVRAAVVLSRESEAARRPVAEVTTSSMEAYNYYLRGVQDLDRSYNGDARRVLEMAVALDSTFAMAHLYLGVACGTMRDTALRDRHYAAARRFGDRATERERLYIEARYASVIEKNGDKHDGLLRELIRKYPKEKVALSWLGERARRQGRVGEAIALCEQALALDPDYAVVINEIAYAYLDQGDLPRALEYLQRYAAASPGDANPVDSMAEAYFRIGDLDRSIAAYEKAVELKPDFVSSMKCAAYVCGVKGDLDQAQRWVDRFLAAAPTSGLRELGCYWRSEYLYMQGRIDAAMSSVADGRRPETSGGWLMMALCHLSLGEFDEAERDLEGWEAALIKGTPEAAERARAWHANFLALVQARAGRPDEAARSMETMNRLGVPLAPTDIRPYVIDARNLVQAEVLLSAGRLDDAIAMVRSAPSPPIPHMLDGPMLAHNAPFEWDVAARAFAARGDWPSAAVEWERHVTFDPARPERRIMNPIYHYRLAQAYEHLGRTGDAIAQYTRFLACWHAADPGRPELIDARRRLDELRRVVPAPARAGIPARAAREHRAPVTRPWPLTPNRPSGASTRAPTGTSAPRQRMR